MPNAKHYTVGAVIKRLYCDYIKKYRKSLLAAVFFMILVAITTTVIVRLLKPLTDLVFIKQDKDMYLLIPCLALFAYCFKGLAELTATTMACRSSLSCTTEPGG